MKMYRLVWDEVNQKKTRVEILTNEYLVLGQRRVSVNFNNSEAEIYFNESLNKWCIIA